MSAHDELVRGKRPNARLLMLLQRPWLQRLVAFLQGCLGILAVVPVFLLFMTSRLQGTALLAIPFILLSVFATTAVHEFGHFLAARIAGMHVMVVQIGFVQLVGQRAGWRVRLRRPHARTDASGYILAIPDFDRSLRAQEIPLILGGPLMNLLVAGLSAGIGWILRADPIVPVFWSFAGMNALVGLINLLPHAGSRNDGYQLLAWLNNPDPDDPLFSYAKAVWLSLRGITADQLPRALLDALDAQPMPMPLIRLWYDMKGAQNSADWQHALALAEECDTRAAALGPRVLVALREFLSIMRAESAFSKALLALDPSPLRVGRFSARQLWHAPHLNPRLDALRTAILGDRPACERLLAESQRAADNSIDRALHESERRLREAVRRVLERTMGRNVEQRTDVAEPLQSLAP